LTRGCEWLPCLVLLSACATTATPQPCAPASRAVAVAWLVDQGWHTEIGLPASEISGPLGVFRDVFPGATTLMFGFGKRTFITAKVESFSELLMGPIPGPGAIQVIGLRTEPPLAFTHARVIRLSLLPGQAGRLSGFIWDAIGKTRDGRARLISQGLFPGSLFYAASRGYGLTYTCNTWSAQALQVAGLPIDPDGISLPHGLLAQTARLGDACLMAKP
jgi:hypothetical protein